MLMTFQPMFQMDIEPLTSTLAYRESLFDEIRLRQNTPGSAHHDTRTIYLRGPVAMEPGFWTKDIVHCDYPALKEWPEAREALEVIAARVKSQISKAMIVSLKPGGFVDWHIDQGEYADTHCRGHLPLATNDHAYVYAGDESGTLAPSFFFKFNNRVLHSAINLGDTPRIHLIVDWRK